MLTIAFFITDELQEEIDGYGRHGHALSRSWLVTEAGTVRGAVKRRCNCHLVTASVAVAPELRVATFRTFV